MKRLVWLGVGLAFGCSPAAVDYSALSAAAAKRQHWAPGPAHADVHALLQRPLDLDAAARIALFNNRAARAAAEQLGIAQAELSGVKHLPNPTLEGALRFQRAGDPDIDLAAMLDISALLLAISRTSAAQAGVEADKLEAVGVMVDLSFEARRAFVSHEAARERVELRRQVLGAFAASSAAAERLREAGNVTALELASEQAQREQARLELTDAEASAAAAREHLNGVLGLFGDQTRWKSAGRLPDVPKQELALASLERDALLASLDLAAARQRYTAAAKQAGVADVAGWLPELKAGVSAERAEDWSIGPALELELPLFYQGQGEAGAARARMKQAEHLYADAAVQVRSEARAARVGLAAARTGLVHMRDVVLPLRGKVVEQTQLEYNGMLVGIFALLQAKREELEAGERYLDLRRDYWLRRLDAEQLLAGRRVKRQVFALD